MAMCHGIVAGAYLAASRYIGPPTNFPSNDIFSFYIAGAISVRFHVQFLNMNCSPISVAQYSKFGLSRPSIFLRYRKVVLFACAIASRI